MTGDRMNNLPSTSAPTTAMEGLAVFHDPTPARHPPLVRLGLWASLAAFLVTSSGCSYILFLGYLIGGPPTIEPDFDVQTKESMTDKDVTVAVVCYAPTDIRYSFEDIDHEVAKYVAFRLIQHKIKVISPDRVRAWLDENRDWDKPEEIGEFFKATYVVYIDLNNFSLYEDDSANLYRGRAEAVVSVWKMEGSNDAEKIYTTEKISKFPTHQPIAASDETYQNFKARYLARLSDEIGRLFYEYTTYDEIGESG
jgi:hypothetical protein